MPDDRWGSGCHLFFNCWTVSQWARMAVANCKVRRCACKRGKEEGMARWAIVLACCAMAAAAHLGQVETVRSPHPRPGKSKQASHRAGPKGGAQAPNALEDGVEMLVSESRMRTWWHSSGTPATGEFPCKRVMHSAHDMPGARLSKVATLPHSHTAQAVHPQLVATCSGRCTESVDTHSTTKSRALDCGGSQQECAEWGVLPGRVLIC